MKVEELIEQVERRIDCPGCQRAAGVYVEVDGKRIAVTGITVEDQGGEYEDHPPIDLILETDGG